MSGANKKPSRQAGHRPQSIPAGTPTPSVTPSMEKRVGISTSDLFSILLLGSVRGLGPQVFKAIYNAGLTPMSILEHPADLPIPGRRGERLRDQIESLSEGPERLEARAKRYIAVADNNGSEVITYTHPEYPKRVLGSNYPVPVMFARGHTRLLNPPRSVACVGSRAIKSPYSNRQDQFARHAAQCGFAIVSGFALGADSIAHRAAFESSGSTICVMPGGLDRPFPPENRGFWNELLEYRNAVFISESPFGTLASSLSLRKRNKLILSFAEGVLVGQSSASGGAMNAYRFALEQRKQVATFESDGTEETGGNLEISRTTTVPATTFQRGQPDDGAWDIWLQGL